MIVIYTDGLFVFLGWQREGIPSTSEIREEMAGEFNYTFLHTLL